MTSAVFSDSMLVPARSTVCQDLRPAFVASSGFNDYFEFGIGPKIRSSGILAEPVPAVWASDELGKSFVNSSDHKIRDQE